MPQDLETKSLQIADAGSLELPVESRGSFVAFGGYVLVGLAGFLALSALLSLAAQGSRGVPFAIGAVSIPLLGAWLLFLIAKYLFPDRIAVGETAQGLPENANVPGPKSAP